MHSPSSGSIRGEDVKTYIQAVEGRINALARVHTILSLSSWQGAELASLVDEELAPYADRDQISFRGTEIRLQPTTAQTLALALHELVTNSAKYGALSTVSGRLSVSWEVQGELLQIDLGREAGARGRKAGAARLWNDKRNCQHRIPAGGEGLLEWRPEGLICRLTVPLDGGVLGTLTSPRSVVQDSGIQFSGKVWGRLGSDLVPGQT